MSSWSEYEARARADRDQRIEAGEDSAQVQAEYEADVWSESYPGRAEAYSEWLNAQHEAEEAATEAEAEEVPYADPWAEISDDLVF